MKEVEEESLVGDKHDPFLNSLNKVVLWCVKGLTLVMVLVIIWAFVDVLFHVYTEVTKSIDTAFSVDVLFSIIGSILFFLIAIEIYLNIVFFLQKDSINVALVVATALTAISRKVIILDYTATSNEDVFAMAALIFAVGVTFWVVARQHSHQ